MASAQYAVCCCVNPRVVCWRRLQLVSLELLGLASARARALGRQFRWNIAALVVVEPIWFLFVAEDWLAALAKALVAALLLNWQPLFLIRLLRNFFEEQPDLPVHWRQAQVSV